LLRLLLKRSVLKKWPVYFLSLFMIFSIIGPLPVMAGSGGVETGADLEASIANAVAWYQTNHPSPDSWEGLPALWGVGEDLNEAPWGTGQGWRENDPGFAANTTGNEHIYYIFKLLAVGKNPADIWNGRNLFAELADQQRRPPQTPPDGAFGDLGKHIWAIVLLDVGEELGVVDGWGNTQCQLMAITHLINQQNDDGSFGAFSQLDYTGWALTALSNHQKKSNAQEAIGKAIDFLHSKQQDNAGFALEGMWGEENCNSNAAVISGLVAVGEDVLNPEGRWVKDGQTVLDVLLKYQQEDGSFWYKEGTAGGVKMSTVQALLALADLKHGESTRHRMGQIQFAEPQKVVVKLTVEGKTETIFPTAEVEVLTTGDQPTALDVLEQGLDAKGIPYELQYFDWGILVNSIAGEENGAFGGWDGWTYTVNGVSPDVGAADYIVQENDEVFFYYSRWPVLSSEAVIDVGEVDPRVEINLVGDEYADPAETKDLDNWTIDTGETGLSVEEITKDAAQKVTVAFTGTAAVGEISIQAGAAALGGDAASEEFILKIETAEPATYTLTLTGEGLTSTSDAGEIEENTAVTITVTAPAGKQVAIFTVNGEDKKADLEDNKYTFTITADTTVAVTYEGTGGSSEESNITVTFKLTGDSGQTWIPTTSVEMPQGATVFDMFDKVLSEKGMEYRASYDSYVSGIKAPSGEWLNELDKGPLSGWMYKVNGKHTTLALNEYLLKQGDAVVFYYTDDFTKEEGSEGWSSSGGGGGGATKETFQPSSADDRALQENLQQTGVAKLSLEEKADGKVLFSPDFLKNVNEEHAIVLENKGIKVELAGGALLTEEFARLTAADNSQIEVFVQELAANKQQEILSKDVPEGTAGFVGVGSGIYEITLTVVDTAQEERNTGKELDKYSKPIKITIDFSHLGKLSPEQSAWLTGVRLENDGEGLLVPIGLGGEYDPETQTFAFFTDHLSFYTVMQSQEKETKIPFTDLQGYEWAREAIGVLSAAGIISGRGEGVFEPGARITRAEFAALVTRLLGYNDTGMELPFTDVHVNSWYYEAVARAYHHGILSGRSATVFDPESSITRQEMAAIIGRVLRPEGSEGAAAQELGIFSDRDEIAVWAKDGVGLCTIQGIITGMGDGTFAPLQNANRAQAAVMLYRLSPLE
jgi:hypothetical protein